MAAIVDLNLPGMSGLTLAHQLRVYDANLPLVMVTAMRGEDCRRFGQLPCGVPCLQKPLYLEALEGALMSGASGAHEAASAFRAGALDFLIKPMDADDLLNAIARALARSTQCTARRQRAQDLANRIANLTAREREVARHVAQGLTNPVIAIKLGLALRTVKLYRQTATEKLGVDTTAEPVRIADEAGI